MGYGDRDSPVLKTSGIATKNGQNCRKKFSHRRTKFPSAGSDLGGAVEEGTGEFQAKQVVSVRVVDAYGSRAQGPSRLGQGPAHRHQRPPRADVQCRGELEELLALVVSAAYEHRNRQW